eukprot:TRINITY_DN14759_c0_g1_i1.p1 TRINITY_DN14759_c0_g1~~TRINITY_DN14759_c0_g1_i1.p1  ORF type:complete len:222 (+),score=21.80 TRINITY_DN14759_c0_g1_i1:22-687(+)
MQQIEGKQEKSTKKWSVGLHSVNISGGRASKEMIASVGEGFTSGNSIKARLQQVSMGAKAMPLKPKQVYSHLLSVGPLSSRSERKGDTLSFGIEKPQKFIPLENSSKSREFSERYQKIHTRVSTEEVTFESPLKTEPTPKGKKTIIPISEEIKKIRMLVQRKKPLEDTRVQKVFMGGFIRPQSKSVAEKEEWKQMKQLVPKSKEAQSRRLSAQEETFRRLW